jgi:TPR repeat protein
VVHVANNADVEIDGTKVPADRATHLSAGVHTVVVTVPGYQPYTTTVQLAAGTSHDVTPQLVVAPKVVPKPGSATDVAKQQAQDASRQAANANLLCDKFMVAHDWKQAFSQCTTEAANGSAVAKRNLGLMYNHGNGVGKSADDAVRWYQQAVDGNDHIAMYLLGTYYEHGGGGIQKNSTTAVALYTRSAQGGYVVAQSLLGEIYEKGHLDQQKDKAKALEWYKKAAAQGDKDATDKVKDLGHN